MDVKLVHAPVRELIYNVVSPTRVNIGVFVYVFCLRWFGAANAREFSKWASLLLLKRTCYWLARVSFSPHKVTCWAKITPELALNLSVGQ